MIFEILLLIVRVVSRMELDQPPSLSIDGRRNSTTPAGSGDVPAGTDPLYDVIGDPCTFVGL